MKRTAFIIHGSYGNPEENWIPWLKRELQQYNFDVIVPKFPTPNSQSLSSWLEAFEPFEKYLNHESVVIGHSLGPAFLMQIIQKLSFSIVAAYFIAPFIGELGNPKFDIVNKTFFDNLNWEQIKIHCKNFYIYYSDNDPYVPQIQAKTLAKRLGISAILIKTAGHFNTDAGYTQFSQLLKHILHNKFID